MAIINTDIVLFQSQDNTDNDNGGGSRINVPVADGAVNNLFPDISRIDTVLGDVAMRKVFPVVNTDNRDIYYGAHAIIRKIPDDPRVSALLFSTDDSIDVRVQAQSDVESYLIPSYQASFYLFGANVEGAKAVTFLQRVEEPLPTVGDVYVLQEGAAIQYIRIVDIESVEINLFFAGDDYLRRRVIATIDQGLTTTFTGSVFNPAGQQFGTCDTFATQVADAAKFYGTKDIALDGLLGNTFLQLDSIYEQLVPATTQQSAIVNRQALQSGKLAFYDPNDTLEFTRLVASGEGVAPAQFKTGIKPGSFRITDAAYVDDGLGNFTNVTRGYYGVLNYAEGTLTWSSGAGFGNTFAYYKPAIVVDALIQYSLGIPITTENQGNVYIQVVSPVPTPGSIYIDYRSSGKWYRIQGNPDGTIGGEDGLGAGLVSDNNDGTATVSMTLGAIPEIDSTVIFSWGSTDAINEAKQEAKDKVEQYFEWKLLHENIDPDNCTVVYQDNRGSTIQSLVFSSGALTVATPSSTLDFTLNPEKGILYAHPKAAVTQHGYPTVNEFGTADADRLALTYNYANTPAPGGAGELKFITSPALTNVSPGVYTHDLGAPIKNTGLRIKVNGAKRGNSTFGTPTLFTVTFECDSNGVLRETPSGDPMGTVTSAGLVTLSFPNLTRLVPTVTGVGMYKQARYNPIPQPVYYITSCEFIEYTTENVAVFDQAYSGNLQHYGNCYFNVKLIPQILGAFDMHLYSSTNAFLSYTTLALKINVKGNEVYQHDSLQTQIGAIDRSTGAIKLEFWKTVLSGNIGNFINYFDVSNLAVLSDEPNNAIQKQVFRTGSANLVTSSLILRYTTPNGTFTATTDANGDITGTDIDVANSYVDTTNGAVNVTFNADVDPESVRFDAVAETTLPLDPELLGLNPVRLPPDGRVPIFTAGTVVVVFNEETTAIGVTPIADAVETLGRSGQAYIEVIDVNGQRLAYDQFVADRAAGTVTFANPLSLIDRSGNALTAPYSIVDRVEDVTLCVDASVTGRIELAAPLSRDYLAGTSKAASALVWGDIGSRTFNLFTQASFDVWSDVLTTASINSQFDNINFPIQINNKDSFTGRWALIFTSTTTVDVIEESLGVVLEDAPIATDIAPVNPATGLPYFTIPTGGWGGGWVTSNLFRFNTDSGSENMWIIRTVQSGALTEQNDSIDVEIRGDVN